MRPIRTCLGLMAMLLSLQAGAETLEIRSFRYAGPYPVQKPFMVDSVNVKSKAFAITDLLDTRMSTAGLKSARTVNGDNLPAYEGAAALSWLSFSMENSTYTVASLKIEGLANYRLYVDGAESGKELKLHPGTHQVDIKYLSEDGKKESASVSVDIKSGALTLREDGKHLYGMKDVILGTRFSSASVSPDGKYMIVGYTTTMEGGRSSSASKVMEIASGKTVVQKPERLSWMPKSGKLYYSRTGAYGTDLVSVDPASGAEEVIAESIPQGSFRMSPTEDFLIYSMSQKGPAEKESIYQILTPDDRQPGWRTRSYAARYDLATGVMQPLTFGFHSSRITDISQDGSKALVMVSEERLTQRPTTVSSLFLMDLATLETRTLVSKDGFMTGASFSPDGKQILLLGSPEAFGGIGLNVKKGQTPNTYDYQMYVMDIASGKISPLTKNFNPAVQTAVWSRSDNNIYFSAENRDCQSLFRLNPKNGRIEQLDTPEEMVKGFSLSQDAGVIAWYGQSASNSDRLYVMNTANGQNTLLEDLSAQILKDVDLGECNAWEYKNSKGEKICARYYLPPHFDPARKYPMIVNYYGGCSPTGRNFESRYPHHAYAALGYVVLVIAGPSGATGFGQEWGARHVNTAGDGPAQDIIEGAQTFCREHPWVNASKVGCIGASYGGFMSQYIPTQTDFFACSISHAGISDHTSYWGFGYWGYSYSETSMANSYPWTRKDLYVDQSPLYNADKINTPILFVHGDADTNVPFNESVQMFTALKLLGKETAFVAVKDQDHHILDYQKRLDWQDTIWAWFAKWLQDDPTWWDALYSPKSL